VIVTAIVIAIVIVIAIIVKSIVVLSSTKSNQMMSTDQLFGNIILPPAFDAIVLEDASKMPRVRLQQTGSLTNVRTTDSRNLRSFGYVYEGTYL
jgi:hypothetical protein